MPSFDIVSRADLAEVDNAINGMTREMRTRFDFKDTACSIERDKETLTILADSEPKLQQMHELLRTYLVRRKVDPEALEFKNPEKASGGSLRQAVVVRQGIPADMAKKVTRAVKDSRLKVQVAMQGDELRVTGKKRDDLQEAIALVKDMKLDQPVQYVNFRD